MKTLLFPCIIAAALLLSGPAARADVIAEYTFGTAFTYPDTSTATYAVNATAAHVTASDVGPGQDLTTPAPGDGSLPGYYGGTFTNVDWFSFPGGGSDGPPPTWFPSYPVLQWHKIYAQPSNYLSLNAYVDFEVTADPGYTLDLTSLTLDTARNSGGGSIYVYSSVDGYASTAAMIDGGSLPTQRPDWTNKSVDLTAAKYQGLSDITFRLYMSDDWYGSVYADNIILNGSVVPEPASLALLAAGGLGLFVRRRRQR